MTTSIIDSLVSGSIFNFRLFRYGVAYDRVTCSWLERFIGGGKERDRFWIYRTGKYKIDDGEPSHVLFKYTSGGKFAFLPPHCGSSLYPNKRKIVYWSNMQSPIEIIEGVKARLDSNSLKDHTVFNTKDLNW